MKNFAFQIVPLPTRIAEEACRRASEFAPDHRIVAADAPSAYPCRHCLRWAQPGERIILFSYSAIPAGHPYAESGPIFVHEQPCRRYETTAEYPSDFRSGRVFRAYNKTFDMIDAQIPNGSAPEAVVEKLFQNPETVFVDVRSADRGCFTFRIERK